MSQNMWSNNVSNGRIGWFLDRIATFCDFVLGIVKMCICMHEFMHVFIIVGKKSIWFQPV